MELFYFRLAALIPLVAYLVMKYRQRNRSIPPTHPVGIGFDTAPLTPTLSRLRSDYVQHLRSRTSRTNRAELLGSARRSILQLAYFQEKWANGPRTEGAPSETD